MRETQLLLREPQSEGQAVQTPYLEGWSPWASSEAPISLDSCKPRWEVPGAEVLFNHLLSIGDSTIGKSQLWSEPSESEMQTERDS